MGAKIKARTGCYTYEDFCALIREDQKADLIDGVIYIASPENIDAGRLFLWLLTVMSTYAEEKQLGEVFGSRIACRFDDRSAPGPDILFVRNEHADRLHRGGVEGAPDLVIEIVSPDSVERDYEKNALNTSDSKFPNTGSLTKRKRASFYFAAIDAGGIRKFRRAAASTGFWLDPSWLWPRRPPRLAIIQQLLAETAGK